jgi:hypothetical protein
MHTLKKWVSMGFLVGAVAPIGFGLSLVKTCMHMHVQSRSMHQVHVSLDISRLPFLLPTLKRNQQAMKLLHWPLLQWRVMVGQ